MPKPPDPDAVDSILVQWRRERPDVNVEAIGVVGRMVLLKAQLDAAFETVAARHDVDRGLADVLAALRRSGPPYRLSPTDLFNSMMVTSGGMTHRLDRLERKGLIARKRHPDDRRGVQVQLTARGRKRIDAILPESMQQVDQALAAIDRKEQKQLADLLRRVLAGFPRKD